MHFANRRCRIMTELKIQGRLGVKFLSCFISVRKMALFSYFLDSGGLPHRIWVSNASLMLELSLSVVRSNAKVFVLI